MGKEIEGLGEKIEAAVTEESSITEQPAATSPEDSTTPKNEDPEFDLGLDDKGQPLKFKRSQILGFQKGSMLQADYTKKTQELAVQKEELKEMFSIVEHLKSNPEKAKRVMAILDEKEEKVEEKIDEIDELLKGLDASDPYAKALIALRKQNQELLKTVKETQEKLANVEQTSKTLDDKEGTKQAQEFLHKTLEDLTKNLKFEDDDDKAEWRKVVLTYLVNNPKKYATEQEFIDTVNSIGKAEYDAVVKRNERITARYIKSKGGGPTPPAHPGGAGAKPLSKKPTMDNLEEVLTEELTGEAHKNEERK